MPYIGKTPTQGVRQRYMYTATAGQTTFSGTDTQNLTLSYSDSNFIDVYQNGVLLKTGTDYTATSGTSVVLTTGASVDDVVEMIVYDVFASADFFNRTDSDSRYVNIDGDTMTGSLDLNGTELILDVDGDTSITADTDDQIDIKVGGADKVTIDSVGKVKFSNFISVGHTNAPSYGVDIQTADTTAYGMRIKSTEEGGSALIRMESDQADDNHDYRNIISDSSGDFRIQSYATGSFVDQFKIASGGNVTISDGDLVIGTNGHGIDFSAVSDSSGGAASSTNALLDDYEEGTFTPIIIGGGTAGTGTYGSQNGTYTKIGRTVTFRFYITWTNHTGNGNLFIGGLPFNAGSQTYYLVQTESISLSSNNLAPAARIESGSNYGLLIQSTTGGSSRFSVPIDTAGEINGQGTYQTA